MNTRRARRALVERLSSGGARLLPRIRVVTELADDPLGPAELPPPTPALRRRLELARLVGGLGAAAGQLVAGTTAFDLADSLAELLDEIEGEGLDPATLATLDVAEHAAHWQASLAFLGLIAGYLAAAGPAEGQGRLRAAAEALAAAWETAPPAHPVIVAGSTGSRGPMRVFMAAVARLPQGALVLPGFDDTLPRAVWDRLGSDDAGAADHPQHGFRLLADAIGFDPAALPRWHPAPPPVPARNALLALALRPAPVTDQWRAEGGALVPQVGAACAGLAWLEAPDQRAEAMAIALRLRHAADEGKRGVLVTPDRTLARRVTAELDRWGLIPDDSAGRPLAMTPPGVLLRLVAGLAGTRTTPEDLLVLLKHPLVNSGPGARRVHLGLTARLETRELRGGAPFIDWDELAPWAAEAGGEAPAWLAWLRAALAPLAADGRAALATHVARHRAAAEALAAGPTGTPAHELWERDAGAEARALMDALAAEAAAGPPLGPEDYRALLRTLMSARDVPEEAALPDARIAIWGTLEARVQSADLVILGGLNEGIWPRLPAADPWLGRGLRRAAGLPSPERRIGLSAHDFQQAAAAPEVVLSRALRDAEAPTVASRWLMRLENLLRGLGPAGEAALDAARARGRRLTDAALRLDLPDASVPPARRPAPRPAPAARPRELSATQAEGLLKDPYATYAYKVLRFRRLAQPGRAPDAMTRGKVVHEALDAFVAALAETPPDAAERLYFDTVRATLDREAPWPATHAVWFARLARAARWFLAGEAERIARGTPGAREVSGRWEVDGLPLPFAVNARADRIDRTPGGYAIYDYKSGNNPSRSEAEQFHLQLPLEAAIAAAGGFEGLDPGRAVHLELLKLGNREAISIPADPASLAAFLDRFRALVRHYQHPANGFVARLRPGRLSWPGDYDHLSRKGEWADGDPPDLRW